MTEAWKVETGDTAGHLFHPQVEGDDVLAAGGSRVVRIAVANGKTVWNTDTGVKLSAGAGAGQGLVLAGSGKGELLALDRASGAAALESGAVERGDRTVAGCR